MSLRVLRDAGSVPVLSVYGVLMATSVALLVVPSTVMSLYGVSSPDVLETALARIIGALAFGLGVVCWNARTAALKSGDRSFCYPQTGCRP